MTTSALRSRRCAATPFASVASLATLAALSACQFPRFEAKKTVESAVPAAGLRALRSESHNGGIDVRANGALEEVRIRAVVTARGHTQEEADAHLAQLDVARETKDGVLHVRGLVPEGLPDHAVGGFAFSFEAPPALAATLVTHNGDVRVLGLLGDVAATTHNGGVSVSSASKRLALETHNGGIDVELTGEGAVGGSIETHNGSVEITFGKRTAAVEATTSNGRIDAKGPAAALTAGRNHARGVVGAAVEQASGPAGTPAGGATAGDGAGSLRISTANGSVRLR